MIFISKSFRTIVIVFIVFSTTFRLLYPPTFLSLCPVYLGIEMIQPGKSFLMFDWESNKAFKKYEDLS